MEAGSEKLPDRAGRRSSVAAEATDGLPGVLLWTVRILSPLLIAGRFLGALLAVGGLVSAVAGLITLDGALIVGGLLQAAPCAVLLGLGGSCQHVVEAGSVRLVRDLRGQAPTLAQRQRMAEGSVLRPRRLRLVRRRSSS